MISLSTVDSGNTISETNSQYLFYSNPGAPSYAIYDSWNTHVIDFNLREEGVYSLEVSSLLTLLFAEYFLRGRYRVPYILNQIHDFVFKIYDHDKGSTFVFTDYGRSFIERYNYASTPIRQQDDDIDFSFNHFQYIVTSSPNSNFTASIYHRMRFSEVRYDNVNLISPTHSCNGSFSMFLCDYDSYKVYGSDIKIQFSGANLLFCPSAKIEIKREA